MNNVNHQETELDSILKEAASFDDFAETPVSQAPEKPRQTVKKPAEKPAVKKPAVKKPAAKPASEKPERGIPPEQRILAGIKANAARKAEEKQAMEEQQAIAAQRAALAAKDGTAPAAETAAPAPAKKAAIKKPVIKKPAVKKPAAPAPVEQTVAAAEEQAKQPAAPAAVPAAAKAAAEQPRKTPAPKKELKLPKLPKIEKKAKGPKAPKEPKPMRDLPKSLTALLVAVSMVCMLWVGLTVHPDTGTATAAAGRKNLDMAEKLNIYMNNASADALSNLTYIKKLYTIPESDVVAPKPQAQFGSTYDPAEVQAVVEQATELLDGQTLAWNPGIQFWDGEPIQYYYDETILAITWKEIINNNMVTFGEVKVAHGSQLRRALAGNSYGSSVEEYPTNMASNVNAVLAINGDFYNFRDLGITVYQREMYRHAPAKVDTAYFTADGDMIFSKRGELMGADEAKQFIADNNVIFSAAFGPVMVENGEKVTNTKYPIGEIDKKYSRACIGQRDDLHYILMTVNYEGPCQYTCTLAQATEYIFSKGVEKAYALDGGQTSSMVFNGELVNRVDWGNERTMSDIIYFASAVPEGGAAE
ncbi:MAG: phosphodiester glycosidase family protein [Oscillospiraceae bacterium]|nr:phosphodiester glycosidase family protein [Oscillospiraceae bacterium]